MAAPRMHGIAVLLTLAGLASACRGEPAPATPQYLDEAEARLEFIDAPPSMIVNCVAGCEGMDVEPWEPGETMVLAPIIGPTWVRLEITAPGYATKEMAVRVDPGVNRFDVDMYPAPRERRIGDGDPSPGYNRTLEPDDPRAEAREEDD